MEPVNLLAVVGVVTLVAGIGIGSMVWAYVGAGSLEVLFKEPIATNLVDADPEATKALQQGATEFNASRYRQAIDRFSQAIQLDSTFAEAFHNRGWRLQICGETTARLSI